MSDKPRNNSKPKNELDLLIDFLKRGLDFYSKCLEKAYSNRLKQIMRHLVVIHEHSLNELNDLAAKPSGDEDLTWSEASKMIAHVHISHVESRKQYTELVRESSKNTDLELIQELIEFEDTMLKRVIALQENFTTKENEHHAENVEEDTRYARNKMQLIKDEKKSARDAK